MSRWIGWFEVGALLGAVAGLALGVLATDPALAADSRMMAALVGSVLEGAIAGALALLAYSITFGRDDTNPGRGPASIVWPRVLRTVALVLLAPVAAFYIGRGIDVVLPDASWKAHSAVTLLTTVAALLGTAVALRAWRPRTLSITVALASLALMVVTLQSRQKPVLEAEIDWGEGRSASAREVAPAPEAAGNDGRSRPNVLLVVLDTTRRDHLSVYGYPRSTTPFLEEMAREGTVYDRAISPAPWTLPSHASMFTGQPPSVHGATKDRYWLGSEFVTVAELLRDAGYATVGLSSAAMVSAALNMHQGFESFYETFRYEGRHSDPVDRMVLGLGTKRLVGPAPQLDKGAWLVNELAARWLDDWEEEAGERPFFMFVNYFEAHLPYAPPEPHRSRYFRGPLRKRVRKLAGEGFSHGAIYQAIAAADQLEDADYQQLSDLYDACVSYQDARLGELVRDLERRGVLDETLLIVVSDHGENLGEHGGLLGHAFSVHQTLVHVPLLVRYPEHFDSGVRSPDVVSTTGLFATILELSGVAPAPGWPPVSSPLPRDLEDSRDAREDRFAVSEYGLPVFELYLFVSETPGASIADFAVELSSVQNATGKLVLSSSGETTYYDLEADPAEDSPLLPVDSADEIGVLAGQLEEFLGTLPKHEVSRPAEIHAMDEQVHEALRSLGYVQ